MVSGGFDPSSLLGPGISAIGGLLGGLFEDEPPPPGATMLNENKRLVQALIKARLGNKLSLPQGPRLPSFGGDLNWAAKYGK